LTAQAPGQQDQLREQVLLAERSVLYCLGFDLNVSTPYKYVLEYMRGLDMLNAQLGTDAHNLVQATWILLNDRCGQPAC
jgi:hypothetical protein